MSDHSSSLTGRGLAERFGSTSRDRRLESTIRRHLAQSSVNEIDLRIEEPEAAPDSVDDPEGCISESAHCERGRKVAAFLVKEYAAATPPQREFFIQLAAEVVQRIDEERPGQGE